MVRTPAGNNNGAEGLAQHRLRFTTGSTYRVRMTSGGQPVDELPFGTSADVTTLQGYGLRAQPQPEATHQVAQMPAHMPPSPSNTTAASVPVEGQLVPPQTFHLDGVPYELLTSNSTSVPAFLTYSAPPQVYTPPPTPPKTLAPIPTYIPGFSLKQAPAPDFTPDLKVTSSTLADLVSKLADPVKTLFVTDKYNYDRLKHLGNFVCCDYPSVELVRDVVTDSKFKHVERVVGIGGCAALDVAKAVAVDKECIVLPTILSTNCVTKNRSIIGGGSRPKYKPQTATPKFVIVSLPEIMAGRKTTPHLFEHWSMSGWGDFFAKISAMIDQASDAGQVATLDSMRAVDADVIDGLDWVDKNFKGYDEESTHQLSRYVHNAGLKVIEAQTNDNSVGGEHAFYYSMMEIFPYLREVPTHGQIVAVGTLITAKAYAESTGNNELYRKTRAAFEKLGIPTTYSQLRVMGITRETMEASIKAIGKPEVKQSFLGNYFKNRSFDLLDDVFLYDNLKDQSSRVK